jgi:hypothetical protein
MSTFNHIYKKKQAGTVKSCLFTVAANNFLVLLGGEGGGALPRMGPRPSFQKNARTSEKSSNQIVFRVEMLQQLDILGAEYCALHGELTKLLSTYVHMYSHLLRNCFFSLF